MGATDNAAPGQAFAGRLWRFSGCEFDERRRVLSVQGTPVELEAKPLELLHQLLLHAGEVVTKQELLDSVWPGVLVVDGSLATAVSKVRKVLGNDEIIVNVPRVGYRLGCAVETSLSAPERIPTLHFQLQEVVPGRAPWRLVRRLDNSPVTQVWLAEHPKTRETRVFKFAVDEVQLRSLKREVTLARLLREALGERPEFVRILEWHFDSYPYFIEFEYAGPNLAEWFAAQGGISAVPVETRLRILADISRAVAEAHELGVLHKDLKPGNILVAGNGDRTTIKVADFGSGTLLDLSRLGAFGITNAGLTQVETDEGALTGTVLYMAPEVLAGQSPSAASDVYALGVLLYQLLIGEFRKPLSAGWEHSVADPVLREDISLAANGDPERRLKSASDFAERLETVELRRERHDAAEHRKRSEEESARARAAARVRRPWMLITATAVLIAAISIFVLRRHDTPAVQKFTTVAVLPFDNAGSDAAIDFLRFALPDEIATTLSHMRSLSIQPFGSTSRYAGANLDLHKIAAETQVSSLVTGHYVKIGEELQITIEAIDPKRDRLLWRDTLNVPAGNLLVMQEQVSALTRSKLATTLGATDYVRETYPPPSNEEAYNLFLRSLAITTGDPKPNQDAIEMLEKSLALDSKYAPAWLALSGRLYAASRFAGGGRAMLDRSDEAGERALALDPGSIETASELILHRTERGDLVQAFRQAQELLKSRPDNALAHYLMSYVLRYGGDIEGSKKHCEAAALLEPVRWSPCSTTYMELGDYAKARALLRDDLGSEWSRAHGIEILLRQGKIGDAVKLAPPQIPGWTSYGMLLACARQDTSVTAAMAQAVKPDDDPEVNYLFAGHLAYCGQVQAAARMLKETVAGHYCSYPAIDRDPFFDKIRSTAAFEDARKTAVACSAEFGKATHREN